MLDWYIGECIVSVININTGMQEPTCGYLNFNTSQILILGGYVKMGESLYAQLLFGSMPF